MYSIAKMNSSQRDMIFSKCAFESGISKTIVEKDFWVTLMLDYLFNKFVYKDCFIFKGGTSLSKCYNLINRFSEDIDLIINWKLLTSDNPNNKRSNTKQDAYNKKLNELCGVFIKEKMIPILKKDFIEILNDEPQFEISDDDNQIIIFNYPRIYDEQTGVLNHIRLEIGPLAALSPVERVIIRPMISNCEFDFLKYDKVEVLTVTPERTFWEKVLILHQQYYKPITKKINSRYSRHYYDVYKISQTKYKELALSDINLLNKVREFKKKFYPSSWSRYDLANIGTIRLIPPDYRIKELEQDFKNMKEMINDSSIVSFKFLLEKLKELEAEINNIAN